MSKKQKRYFKAKVQKSIEQLEFERYVSGLSAATQICTYCFMTKQFGITASDLLIEDNLGEAIMPIEVRVSHVPDAAVILLCLKLDHTEPIQLGLTQEAYEAFDQKMKNLVNEKGLSAHMFRLREEMKKNSNL